MRPRRRAISPIISTMIITAATLVLVVGILAYSNNLFNNETESAEYSQAQAEFVNLADGIDSISSSQGASVYAQFSSRTGGPAYNMSAIDGITVTANVNVTGATTLTLISGSVNSSLLWKAGSGVGTGPLVNLTGTLPSIVVNNQYPLGRVYTVESKGAWVKLDYDRIGIVDLGILNVSTGVAPSGAHTAWDYIHLIQVFFINFTWGGVQPGSGQYDYVSATNSLLSITSPYPRVNYTVTMVPFNTTVPSTQVLFINLTQSSGGKSYYSFAPTTVVDNDSSVAGGYELMPVSWVIEVIQPVITINFIG